MTKLMPRLCQSSVRIGDGCGEIAASTLTVTWSPMEAETVGDALLERDLRRPCNRAPTVSGNDARAGGDIAHR
jgi:hypothetical protein